MGKWLVRIQILRVSKIAIIVLLSLSVILAGFSIYGNKVGTFVISIADENDVGLSLCKTENLSESTARLVVKGIKEQIPATYTDIPSNITDGVGTKNDEKYSMYMAFSFYLINESDISIDYTMKLTITKATRNVDTAIRVMLIENDAASGEIYAKKETSEENYAVLADNTSYTTEPFVSNEVVMKKTVSNFIEDAHTKYTVVIWLEGWDAECTNNLIGGTIKMSMTFTGF